MADKEKMPENKNVITRIGELLRLIIHFVTYEIWRIGENEVSGLKRIYIFLAKTVILAVRGARREEIHTKASALTYSTILAIVPLLAVIVGIASGFGLDDIVRQNVNDILPGHEDQLRSAFEFADNFLKVAKGGVFLGIGVVLLLYTVINLISTIEGAFNDIWQVHSNRSWRRKIADYLAFLIILPAIMTASSGLSIYITTLKNAINEEFVFLTPVTNSLLNLAPYALTILFFTALYILVPNTKVKFLNALAAGVIVGCAFQIFQFIYISGQIWVTKYNAVYGSFAALPLLFLWLQLSWVMCLFGAEIAYASQNVKKFGFERDSTNISRRYKDFLTILIASLIIKRFEVEGSQPYTADELSDENRIPIRLTTEILYLLKELDIIDMRAGDDERIVRYQPALDINKITVGYLMKKIDEHGSENFKIDYSDKFEDEWKAIIETRKAMYNLSNNLLLKDL